MHKLRAGGMSVERVIGLPAVQPLNNIIEQQFDDGERPLILRPQVTAVFIEYMTEVVVVGTAKIFDRKMRHDDDEVLFFCKRRPVIEVAFRLTAPAMHHENDRRVCFEVIGHKQVHGDIRAEPTGKCQFVLARRRRRAGLRRFLRCSLAPEMGEYQRPYDKCATFQF